MKYRSPSTAPSRPASAASAPMCEVVTTPIGGRGGTRGPDCEDGGVYCNDNDCATLAATTSRGGDVRAACTTAAGDAVDLAGTEDVISLAPTAQVYGENERKVLWGSTGSGKARPLGERKMNAHGKRCTAMERLADSIAEIASDLDGVTRDVWLHGGTGQICQYGLGVHSAPISSRVRPYSKAGSRRDSVTRSQSQVVGFLGETTGQNGQ